jgi:hypothetical protein
MIPCMVYLLCAATSLVCAVLLWRGYRRSRAGLLLWSSWCFIGLTITNTLLFLDMIVFPDTDLRLARDAISLVSIGVLVFGLIWTSHE